MSPPSNIRKTIYQRSWAPHAVSTGHTTFPSAARGAPFLELRVYLSHAYPYTRTCTALKTHSMRFHISELNINIITMQNSFWILLFSSDFDTYDSYGSGTLGRKTFCQPWAGDRCTWNVNFGRLLYHRADLGQLSHCYQWFFFWKLVILIIFLSM